MWRDRPMITEEDRRVYENEKGSNRQNQLLVGPIPMGVVRVCHGWRAGLWMRLSAWVPGRNPHHDRASLGAHSWHRVFVQGRIKNLCDCGSCHRGSHVFSLAVADAVSLIKKDLCRLLVRAASCLAKPRLRHRSPERSRWLLNRSVECQVSCVAFDTQESDLRGRWRRYEQQSLACCRWCAGSSVWTLFAIPVG